MPQLSKACNHYGNVHLLFGIWDHFYLLEVINFIFLPKRKAIFWFKSREGKKLIAIKVVLQFKVTCIWEARCESWALSNKTREVLLLFLVIIMHFVVLWSDQPGTIYKYIVQFSLVATNQNMLRYGLPAPLAIAVSCFPSEYRCSAPRSHWTASENCKFVVILMDQAVQTAQGP